MPDPTEPRKRVLLVDDDFMFLSAITEQLNLLSEGGWDIVTADSATKALALLQEGNFHLVVVDLQMPVMNGNQFLMLVKRRYPTLHKVVLTGYATDEERAACLSNGAELCLDKPRSPSELQALFSALNELVQWQSEEGFRGVLRRVGLEDVIQMECLSRHSTLLEISGRAGGGEIYIQEGRIIHAASTDQQGEEAFNQLLALRGGEFHLRPFTPPPAQTIDNSWEFLLMEAARRRDEVSSAEPTTAPAIPQPPPAAPAPARPPTPPTPAPKSPAAPDAAPGLANRIFPAHPLPDNAGSPFRKKLDLPPDSIPDLAFPKSPSQRGLDLAAPIDTSGRLVCDINGNPVELPPEPPTESPIVIQELLLCDGAGEVLTAWQCPSPDRWIQFLEFVSQKSRQLAHGLSAGQVERLAVFTHDSRLVVRVGVDYGVAVRAAPGLPPPDLPSLSSPLTPQDWLDQLAPPPQIAGWGIRFPDKTNVTFAFSDRLGIGVLDNAWRTVSDLYQVLMAQRFIVQQVRWDFELGQLHVIRRPDGLSLNLFATRSQGHGDNPAIQPLLDEFATLQFHNT